MIRQIPALRSRPWPDREVDASWGLGVVVLCFLGVQVVSILWASVVVGLVYGTGDVPPLAERSIWMLPLVALGLWTGYLASPYVARRLTGRGSLVDFDLRAGPVQAVAAVVAGVGCQLLLLPPLYWVILRLVEGDPGRTAADLVDRVDGPVQVAVLVLAVVVVTPLVEEWFYRGMLLAALVRRFGPAAGAVISSLVFAAVHQELILLPGLFLFALVLAGLTIWTGRLGVAVLAHAAFNATTVVDLLAS